MPCNHITSNE